MTDHLRLDPGKLRITCDPEAFSFETTEDIDALDGIIGQHRAVSAARFGLGVRAPGYNIYLAGPSGTGKMTFALSAVKERAEEEPDPDDWCYIHNFEEPDSPRAVNLPAGQANVFKSDMEELVEELRAAIPRAFESADFEEQRTQVLRRFQEESAQALRGLEQMAQEQGFQLKRTSSGFVAVPIKEGEPLTQEEYSKLEEEERQKLEEIGKDLQGRITETLRQLRSTEREARQEIAKLEREIGLSVAVPLIDRLRERYRESSRVLTYLDQVQEDVAGSLDLFKGSEEEGRTGLAALVPEGDRFSKYRVNVLVNNARTKGAPVEVENNPTYYNLVGKMEYISQMGAMSTDFTMIKPGALHRANGGYLIVNARDVLSQVMAWDALKRALKSKCISIENIGEQFRLVPASALKPEPIPLNVKVLLLGNPLIYHLLYAYDEDFRKMFKIRADFDVQMRRNEEHMERYAHLISSLCRRENLLHFSRAAVARIVDEGTRLASDQEKLSTRFNEVVEIVYEADALASQAGASRVDREHVEEALEARVYRSNRIEERIQEMISRGKIMVDVEGKVTGQVNGIAVYSLGDYAFGKPTRITARTFMGRSGVVNIEREIRLSGRSHSKGIMILSAYLGYRFAQNKPLALSASLTFEQTYEEVDGDSASSAELYALLSSLAGVGLRQDLAVTGSVNQEGQIQPIGGVNEKVEGFYATCKARGLTGTQGIIIPIQNVDNLMLKPEVVEAVEKGEFHVYAVSHIDEGIQILTGLPAGEADSQGQFPEGSVYAMVDARLRSLAEDMVRFGRQVREEEKKEDSPETRETEVDQEEDPKPELG